MHRYIFTIQDINLHLIPKSSEADNELSQIFRFKRYKKESKTYIKKGNNAKVYINKTEKISLKYDDFQLIGETYTEKDKISCFKNNGTLFYLIEDRGYIKTSKPNQFEIFLLDFKNLPLFITVIVIMYCQLEKKFICLHAGCFKYRNNTYLIIGQSESGKTTFLTNLKRVEPDVEFVCDDLNFLYSYNGSIYSRGILNSFEASLKIQKRKLNNNNINWDSSFNNFKDLVIDKLLFLNIVENKGVSVKKIDASDTLRKLLYCTTLWGVLSKKQITNNLQNLFKLIVQTDSFLMQLGKGMEKLSRCNSVKLKNILEKIDGQK